MTIKDIFEELRFFKTNPEGQNEMLFKKAIGFVTTNGSGSLSAAVPITSISFEKWSGKPMFINKLTEIVNKKLVEQSLKPINNIIKGMKVIKSGRCGIANGRFIDAGQVTNHSDRGIHDGNSYYFIIDSRITSIPGYIIALGNIPVIIFNQEPAVQKYGKAAVKLLGDPKGKGLLEDPEIIIF
jgi:hypothetical protein